MTLHTIHVMRSDIKKGIRDRCMRCPIALAMKRHWSMPSVYRDICFPETDEVALPAEARLFIEHFDAGKPVKPFRFTLEV